MNSPEPPPPPPPPPPAAVDAAPGDYPAWLEVEPADEIARWRPLFQWVLAIPHLIIAGVLSYVAEIVGLISWFAILFTGKLPNGLAGAQCMVQRYTTRTYTYAAGLRAEYPPFDFSTSPTDPGEYQARVQFLPEFEGRNRLTVGLRFIWAIPALIVTVIIFIIAWVCWLIGAIAVLFTGKWPHGLRAWVLKGLRAGLRLNAYCWLLTDKYPPLNFD
jgi:Domain of unknown function (DUF4389)